MNTNNKTYLLGMAVPDFYQHAPYPTPGSVYILLHSTLTYVNQLTHCSDIEIVPIVL